MIFTSKQRKKIIKKMITKFILENYGNHEVNNPCYDIDVMINYINKGFILAENLYYTSKKQETSKIVKRIEDMWTLEELNNELFNTIKY